eukprot:COSAG06_NODE_9175_length_1967_cov_5.091481_3_plen_127_part_00
MPAATSSAILHSTRSQVRNRNLCVPFYTKNDPFTKTGSGQTWGKLKNRAFLASGSIANGLYDAKEADVDTALYRVLGQQFDLGVFDDPSLSPFDSLGEEASFFPHSQMFFTFVPSLSWQMSAFLIT